jgi:hypothetical protein
VEERSDLGEGLGDVRSKRSSGEEKGRVLLLLLLMLLARGVVSRVGEARKNGRRDGANDILRSPKEGKEEVLNFDGSEGWTNTAESRASANVFFLSSWAVRIGFFFFSSFFVGGKGVNLIKAVTSSACCWVMVR